MSSFLDYLQAEGLVAPEDLTAITADADSETQGRELVDAGILSSDEVDQALLFFSVGSLDGFLEENTINLTSENMDDNFFQEYLSIVIKGFSEYLKVRVIHGDIEFGPALQEELFVYQPMKSEGDSHFIVGVSGAEETLMAMAADLHKRLVAELDMPEFGYTKEDMYDFYAELINNINSSCSYKFNMSFDLEVPEHQENAVLQAPCVHTALFSVLDYNITFFMVYKDTYQFEAA